MSAKTLINNDVILMRLEKISETLEGIVAEIEMLEAAVDETSPEAEVMYGALCVALRHMRTTSGYMSDEVADARRYLNERVA